MNKLTFAVILCLLGMINANAQGSSMLDLDKLTSKASGLSNTMLTGEQFPVANIVDPSIYVVGPGDILAYQTTGLDFTEKLALVSPEGTIMLERIGLVDVRGLTLDAVKDAVKKRLAERSASIEIFITLKRTRLVYVTVNGNVPFPGTYAVPASMRVSTLLQLTRQPWSLRTDAMAKDMGKEFAMSTSRDVQEITKSSGAEISAYARRNIVVKHSDGVSLVDLSRAQEEGQARFDPHLREGDVITVPYDRGQVATISIAGAVVTPAILAYKESDRASTLLAAAGGALDGADLQNVYLINPGSGKKVPLSVDSRLRVTGDNPVLEPGSAIVVGQRVVAGSDATQGVVEVYGEVGTPGSVVIVPGKTRLSQVVEAVGGVKPTAALSLSYIVRPDAQQPTMKNVADQAARSFMYSDLKLEDTLRFQMDQFHRIPYVSCDVEKALKDTNSLQNIALQSGDIVVIKQIPNRIYVYGQVNQPGYVTYVAGKTLEWYVQQAGGFAIDAKEGRARIIRGKNKVWLESNEGVVVEPGDEVYVPRPPAIPAGVELQTYAIIAGILSSVAALTATIITLAR